MTSGYLFLDLQQDFLARPGLVPDADAVIGGAASLLEHARSQQAVVVHVHTVVADDGSDAMAHWREAAPLPCRSGTPGARPPRALAAAPEERVFEKQHYSAFSVPALDTYLKERGVGTLVLAGIYTHACVRATALDASRRGYRVVLADEALGSTEPLHGALTRTWLHARGIRALPLDLIRKGAEATGHPLETVDLAVAATQAPTSGLKRIVFSDRRTVLRAWASELAQRAPSIVETMIDEIGKPRRAAEEEIGRAVAHVETTIALFPSDVEPVRPGCWIRHRPRGTLAVITPWNNPVAIPVGKLAPALLFGNGVVWKPSPRAPRCANLVLETLRNAGAPSDAVEILHGEASHARRLVAADGIDAVTLTGSSQTGRGIDALCRARGIPLQAELGGNNGLILGTRADTDAASKLVVEAAFGFAGQRCTAIRRLIVRRDDEAPLLASLLDRVRTLELLDPNDPGALVGPVIDAGAVARLEQVVADARGAGARVLSGGHGAEGRPGSWFLPTVLYVEDPNAEVVQAESFGPILVVQPARDFEDQLALLGRVPQGLVAAILTRDDAEVDAFLASAHAGILRVNPSDLGFDARAPFGGRKASGLGPPEHGVFDREFYAVPQAVYGAWEPRG